MIREMELGKSSPASLSVSEPFGEAPHGPIRAST